MDVSKKVVLVTGASSGIGKATAILFASRGARLALLARDSGRLRAAAAACADHGRQPLIIIADLATDDGCERAAKETLQHFGRLDVLVNNAGICLKMSLETADMESFDRVFNTDVRGVFNLTRLLAPALIEAKGNIVNISSVAANLVTPMILPYSMAKAALDQFTRQIAFELAPKGVRVNAISPGITDTRIHQRNTGCSNEEYEAWIKDQGQSVPFGQVCQPEHIAKMIVFVASEDCELVTGNIVKVDGGVALKP